ncbi:MAG: hypothetical protein AAFR16_11620, partial [Pseudomonadota bacterium]
MPPSPWSIKGIGPDARRLAKEAAQREGVTLGAWMSRKIAEAADDADAASPRAGPDAPAAADPAPQSDVLTQALTEMTTVMREFRAQRHGSDHSVDRALEGVGQRIDGLAERLDSWGRTVQDARVQSSAAQEATSRNIAALATMSERMIEAEREVARSRAETALAVRAAAKLTERLTTLETAARPAIEAYEAYEAEQRAEAEAAAADGGPAWDAAHDGAIDGAPYDESAWGGENAAWPHDADQETGGYSEHDAPAPPQAAAPAAADAGAEARMTDALDALSNRLEAHFETVTERARRTEATLQAVFLRLDALEADPAARQERPAAADAAADVALDVPMDFEAACAEPSMEDAAEPPAPDAEDRFAAADPDADPRPDAAAPEATGSDADDGLSVSPQLLRTPGVEPSSAGDPTPSWGELSAEEEARRIGPLASAVKPVEAPRLRALLSRNLQASMRGPVEDAPRGGGLLSSAIAHL